MEDGVGDAGDPEGGHFGEGEVGGGVPLRVVDSVLLGGHVVLVDEAAAINRDDECEARIYPRDGADGVLKAGSEQPDLILMDLSLPVLDGWEATRQIKANASTSHIPLIVLTANAMTGEREKALAAGCDDFDTKPVEFERLLGKIYALKPQESQS